MWVTLQLALVFLTTTIPFLGASSICSGTWEASGGHHFNGLTSSNLSGSFVNDSVCPVEVLNYNCYFHKIDKSRLRAINQRTWKHDNNSSCRDYYPIEMLSALRNKRLLMIGDSTMFETWSTLICSFRGLTEMKTSVDWEKSPASVQRGACPWGVIHCHATAGSAYFPYFNATISLAGHTKYDSGFVTYSVSAYNIQPTDAVIVNLGLWYEQESEYEIAIAALSREIDTILQNFQLHFQGMKLKLFFLETFPQHFAGGTYHKDRKYTHCVVVDDHATRDWRNKVIRKYFNCGGSENNNNTSSGVDVISVAHGLYSQFDAHVETNLYYHFAGTIMNI